MDGHEKSRRDFWANVYQTFGLKYGFDGSEIVVIANKALEDFDAKFPAPPYEDAPEVAKPVVLESPNPKSKFKPLADK